MLKNDSRYFRTALTGSIANDKDSTQVERLSLKIGGGRRDRTDDPLLAKQVLSQLSYAPMYRIPQVCTAHKTVVGLVGFEPTTPALSRRCSNRLSYRPLSLSLIYSR
ncbi:conserved hypothetical protein [Burkholderia cepacia]